MRITWRGLELPTRVERDEQISTENMGGFISNRLNAVLERRLATVCVVFCCHRWKAVRWSPLRFPALTMSFLQSRV